MMFDPLVISFLNHFGDFLIIELVDILGLYPGYPETKPVSGNHWKLGLSGPQKEAGSYSKHLFSGGVYCKFQGGLLW